jgi:F-type H+-transporting ATPase subunit b
MQINLAPDLSLLAIMVIFLANYMIVRKFFFEPVGRMLDVREAETRGADQAYEEALAKLNAATAEMENQLHAAKKQAQQVRDSHRADAAAYRTSIVEKTQTEARAVVSEADAKLGKDVEAARAQIVSESDSLARLAAERILGRAV